MTRLVIMVKSKIFKGYSIILNRQCYRSLCVDVMMLASLFCYLFILFISLVLQVCMSLVSSRYSLYLSKKVEKLGGLEGSLHIRDS